MSDKKLFSDDFMFMPSAKPRALNTHKPTNEIIGEKSR
jgi:hypothetical protein